MPYHKAAPRNISPRGRKRGKWIIATDTPEKEELKRQGKLRMDRKKL